MTLPSVLFGLIFLALAITVATDNFGDLLMILVPKVPWQEKKLVIAFILTAIGVIGYNQGIITMAFEAANVPLVVARFWFVYFDLGLTILILGKGAQGLHKLFEALSQYQFSKQFAANGILVEEEAESIRL